MHRYACVIMCLSELLDLGWLGCQKPAVPHVDSKRLKQERTPQNPLETIHHRDQHACSLPEIPNTILPRTLVGPPALAREPQDVVKSLGPQSVGVLVGGGTRACLPVLQVRTVGVECPRARGNDSMPA